MTRPPNGLPPLAWILVLAFGAVADATAAGWRNPKDSMEFVWVPPGSFVADVPRGTNQPPDFVSETIAFPTGFWLGRTEVTVAQFRAFVEATGHATDAEKAGHRWTWKEPGFPQADDHPVVYVSFTDAQAYATWSGTDLPTEAEWLYACRAGATTRFSWGDDMDDQHVWHRGNTEAIGTQPVATKLPNPWGLHDLVGNAWEYCRIEGSGFALRGGSWIRCVTYVTRGGTPTDNLFAAAVAPRLTPFDPHPRFPPYPWDDDRGFRCLKRVQRWAARRPPSPMVPIRVQTPNITVDLVRLPAGEFVMGSSDGANDDLREQPPHRVQVLEPFELGRTEVTVAQFRAFVEATDHRTDAERAGGAYGRRPTGDYRQGLCWRQPEFPQTDEHPVLWVSWRDAVAFCAWLAAETGSPCRLPTEAEWEYACRAGSAGPAPGARHHVDWNLGWHVYNSGVTTHPVAQKPPNPWGLYDLHGNVWEWCADLLHFDYTGAPPDTQAWLTGTGQRPGHPEAFRIIRGGAYNRPPDLMRAGCRYALPEAYASNVGFRVARSLSP
ncbi:MAG: SUMF1/EgtB/PvdO family nonheme iron enzyme [Verrucomicrobiales bacterium]|nr:SUMF1/EgtB/PvdO family nonheme iron enzyme [Verrucomicrobiales bacterium]